MKTYPINEEDSCRDFVHFSPEKRTDLWCSICRPIVRAISKKPYLPKSITIGTKPFNNSKKVLLSKQGKYGPWDCQIPSLGLQRETVISSTCEFLKQEFPTADVLYIRFNFD